MLKKFVSYYKPHLNLFFIDIVCASTVAILDLIFPIFSRRFINDYIPNGKIDIIIKLSIMILLLYIVRMICQFVMQYWGHIMGTRIEYDMRMDLFSHIQSLPFKFFDDNKTGQIMSRLVGDLREIGETAHHGPEDIFIATIMIVGSFLLLIRINVMLTLIIFTFVIILIIYAVAMRKYMASAFRDVRNKHADINAQLENSISGIRLSKSFTNEYYEYSKFEENSSAYKKSWNRAYMIMGIFSAGTHFFADILNVIVLCVGGIFKYYGLIDLGGLVAYLLYMTFMIRPIRRLIQFTQQFQSGIAGFQRFYELLKVVPEIVDKEDAMPIDRLSGDIVFDDVVFKYNSDDEKILSGFNLHIEKGKTIALVGPSGVGKTTISNLIPRFYDVTEGAIIVDGNDVRDIKQNDLRKNIGFVNQDVFIFWGTIRENIRYGNPSANEETVIEAAKGANIHDFIMSLKDGYDTIVGERGVKLSGGQKQRVAIARVFLKNPPILILDEATSSLDNVTELAIQKSIEEIAIGRTTIVVAHRLSTIKNADEIIVISNNGIVERGTHKELLDDGNVYKDLYDAQFNGYM